MIGWAVKTTKIVFVKSPMSYTLRPGLSHIHTHYEKPNTRSHLLCTTHPSLSSVFLAYTRSTLWPTTCPPNYRAHPFNILAQPTLIQVLISDGELVEPAQLRAAFRLHIRTRREHGHGIRVWTAGKTSVEHGSELLATMLSTFGCHSNDPVGPDGRSCTDTDVAAFRKAVQYTRLADDGEYAVLCANLNESAVSGGERGRIFYLSIGSRRGLTAAVRSISRHCAPAIETHEWLRVAVDPPLKMDLSDVKSLAMELSHLELNGIRVHVVEHALAMPAVRYIVRHIHVHVRKRTTLALHTRTSTPYPLTHIHIHTCTQIKG